MNYTRYSTIKHVEGLELVVWYQIYLVCIDYNYAGMENVATELQRICAGPVSARDSNISMNFFLIFSKEIQSCTCTDA